MSKTKFSSLPDGTIVEGNKIKRIPFLKREKIGRNDPCPCGRINLITGKRIKHKACCENASSLQRLWRRVWKR